MAKWWRTGLLYWLGGCAVLVIFPLLFQEVMYHFYQLWKVRPLQQTMRDKLEPFLDDEKLLKEEPFFQSSDITANAAPYLNFRLEWAPSTPNLVRQISQNPPKIALPQNVKDNLRSWGSLFPKFHSQIDYEALDFSWMNEILVYDYWDLTELASAQEIFERQYALSFYLTQTAAPHFEELVMFAKLRLMKGIWEGKLFPAVKETRHFAKLLYSTETLLGALAAIAILRAELSVSDYLKNHMQADLNRMSPLSPTTLHVARRAVLGFSAYATLFTPPEVLHRAFLENEAEVGLCPALAKGMLRGLVVRPLLEPRVFWERDFQAPIAALEEVVEKRGGQCRLTHLKKLWNEKQSRLVWLSLVGDQSWDWILLHLSRRLPWIRRGWGFDLAALFLSNGLEAYP